MTKNLQAEGGGECSKVWMNGFGKTALWYAKNEQGKLLAITSLFTALRLSLY